MNFEFFDAEVGAQPRREDVYIGINVLPDDTTVLLAVEGGVTQPKLLKSVSARRDVSHDALLGILQWEAWNVGAEQIFEAGNLRNICQVFPKPLLRSIKNLVARFGSEVDGLVAS